MGFDTARDFFRSIRPLAAAGMLACALAVALLGAFATAVPAWAAEAYPMQSSLEHGASGSCIVNTVGLEGDEGETVFVTVRQDGSIIAKAVPRTIGAVGDDGFAGMFALEADTEKELADSLAKGVSVSVYADQECSKTLYEGSVWPAYASLKGGSSDGGTKLIGAHTGSGGFTAPETLLVDGQAYRLVGAAEQSGDAALTFAYEAYAPANSIDGAIRYVDAKTGEVLSAFTAIPGLAAGDEPRTVEVPQIIESDGKVYRTMSFDAAVQASNPDATSFTILVAQLSDAASASAGHYMAVIEFVDAQTGAVVAADAVYVRGEVSYTTPDTIYRAAGGAGESSAEEYGRVAGEPAVLAFSALNDGVTTGSRTIEVRYERAAPGNGADATFVLIDGSKRVGDASRTIGTFKGGLPPASYVDAGGNEFSLVGEPSDYGPLASGIADAYYLPKGYSAAQEPYTVKVSYVDYATREVIDSEEFASSPDDLADIVFEPPAQFSKDGVTWLRLDGQESISHSYWSQIAEYTVYYRDRSKPLESAPVIEQVRVVYGDNGATAAGAAGGTATAGVDDERLDSGQAYNVVQGEGVSQQAVGQDGVDAVQHRIEENENPLAGYDGGADEQGSTGVVGIGIGIGIAAAAVVLIAVLAFRRKGRKERS